MASVEIFQTMASDVSVDLSGRQISVSKKHLYHTQVRAMVEQMGGKGVPQRVRG